MNTYIVWTHHENLVIRDAVPKMYNAIVDFLTRNYFNGNHLFEVLNIYEEKGVIDQYGIYVMHILRNECTIVAIDEQTNTIHAVALLKWMTKEWRSWVDLLELLTSSLLNEFIVLFHSIVTTYIREFPNSPHDSMHVFNIQTTEALKHNEEFLQKFFWAIRESGRHMKMPRITAFGNNQERQELLERHDFKKISQIIFAMYVTKDGKRPFYALRSVSEYMAYYEFLLEPITPYYEMIPYKPKALKQVPSKEGESEKPENQPNQANAAHARRRSSA